MANSLLDFVMSVVRDPDVAARYAEDPAGAIADAHLTNVTSADVNSLIPVVSESLSTGSPVAGAGADVDSNVWASGAATAAFDAFSDHLSESTVDLGHEGAQHVVTGLDQPADAGAGGVDAGLAPFDAGDYAISAPAQDFHIDDHIDDSIPAVDEPGAHEPTMLIADHNLDHDVHGDAPGFDVFD